MPSVPYLDGWLAQKRLASDMPNNPYDPNSQPYSNRQWTSGWCDRVFANKRGLPLEHDDTDHFEPVS